MINSHGVDVQTYIPVVRLLAFTMVKFLPCLIPLLVCSNSLKSIYRAD